MVPEERKAGAPKPSGAVVFQKFAFGGIASCVAIAIVQPIDMVKVRLQLSGELGAAGRIRNPLAMAVSLWKNEGPLIFYRGLSAGLLRQLSYGTIRMGLFRELSDRMREPGKPFTVGRSVIAGLTAGSIGAFIANPTDVSLVRMQADNTLAPALRRNYKNVFDAMWRIARDEGVTKMWRGCVPTVMRAAALAASQLPAYDLAKQKLKHIMSPTYCSLSSSCVAAVAATVCSLPFDFLKTRVQKQKAGPDGKLPYKGTLDCAIKVARTEGIFAYYKGFPAYFLRIAPISIVLLNVLELLNTSAKRLGWQ